MKRKILALATALALALSLSVCVSAAGQQAGSWTKLSDGYTADTPGTQPTAVPLPDKDTYAITDWVDADHALCAKSLGDKETAFVVVGRDGSEVTLQFATPTAQIIAAQAGRIAYTNQANDTVYVGRFDGKAALTPVLEEKLAARCGPGASRRSTRTPASWRWSISPTAPPTRGTQSSST